MKIKNNAGLEPAFSFYNRNEYNRYLYSNKLKKK